MIKNGTPASPATALASKVLPVKKSTISCNSCFSSSTPATSLNVILFLSS